LYTQLGVQRSVRGHAESSDEGKRRAFALIRQAIGYRMLQWLAQPLKSLDRTALQAALVEIRRS